MISLKFSAISEDEITSFLNKSDDQKDSDSILDSIEIISDLWVLAKMKESYEKKMKNNINLKPR